MRRLVWFSCGAASAVAAKFAVDLYGDEVEVLYCDTMATEHPDNLRFFKEVERWIGRSIKVLHSDEYTTINDVFMHVRWMSGPKGARCTTELKKVPRVKYQRPGDIHIFGFTGDEIHRANKFENANPEIQVEHILLETKFTLKAECLKILEDAGIALPAMYALGFEHNNCLGCVKSSSAGYWNRTRLLFPEVFDLRVRQSRELGVRLVKLGRPDEPGGKRRRIFLDELPLDAQAPDDDIDCGPACQIPEDLSDLLGPE